MIREETPVEQRTYFNGATTQPGRSRGTWYIPPYCLRFKPAVCRPPGSCAIVGIARELAHFAVAVNRVWQLYSVSGIVKTSENFGSRGESRHIRSCWTGWHLNINNGWRLKHAPPVDRGFSNLPPELQDPAGHREEGSWQRMLARQSRVRLPAELIHDSALAASGLPGSGNRRTER